MPVTAQTQVLHKDGAGWIATIRAIHKQELRREPTDGELAAHVAWVMEERDGGWDDKKMRGFVQGLEEWKNLQVAINTAPMPAPTPTPTGCRRPPRAAPLVQAFRLQTVQPCAAAGAGAAMVRVFVDDSGRFRPFGAQVDVGALRLEERAAARQGQSAVAGEPRGPVRPGSWVRSAGPTKSSIRHRLITWRCCRTFSLPPPGDDGASRCGSWWRMSAIRFTASFLLNVAKYSFTTSRCITVC